MTLLVLVISAALSSNPPAVRGQSLATDYGRERTLRITAEAKLELETTSFEMTVDGEPADRQGGGPGDMSSELTRRTVIEDQVLAGEGAHAKKVRRTFETLAETSAVYFGEEERTDEREGPLQGLGLELSEAQDGTPTAKLVEGTAPEDAALLEGHALALPLDALLPADEIAPGASWELDDAAVERVLALALDPKLFPERSGGERGDRGSGDGERGGRRGFGMRGGGITRNLANVTWKGTAKLVEPAEAENGEACARIELEIEGTGELPESPWRRESERGFSLGLSDPAGAAEGTVDVRLEGLLLVSTARRVPVHLELSGRMSTNNEFEREREGRSISMHHVQSGPVGLTVTIEER